MADRTQTRAAPTNSSFGKAGSTKDISIKDGKANNYGNVSESKAADRNGGDTHEDKKMKMGV